MSTYVSLDHPHDGVAVLTMNNPDINNHVSWAAVGEIADALVEERESGTRVVVLASGVEGLWYQHAWLTDLRALFVGEQPTGDGANWMRALQELSGTHVVSIAAVSGDCSGGGAELGWACDLRIAEERAQFGQPEVQIALTTGVGGTSRVARIIGRTATAELVLDGTPFTARRMYELGGVNRVVPDGESIDVALEWAGRLASRPPAALAALKQILIDNDNLTLNEALANEQRLFQSVLVQPAAISKMGEIQARFDGGESTQDVYGEPRA